MKELKIALIISSNQDIRERISNLLMKIDVSLILERKKRLAIERILHLDLKLVFVDIEHEDTEAIDFIQLIKKLRPRLAIIAIIDEGLKELQKSLFDIGVMSCFIKPLTREEEMKSILNGFMGSTE